MSRCWGGNATPVLSLFRPAEARAGLSGGSRPLLAAVGFITATFPCLKIPKQKVRLRPNGDRAWQRSARPSHEEDCVVLSQVSSLSRERSHQLCIELWPQRDDVVAK
jgi:hypothetical protein